MEGIVYLVEGVEQESTQKEGNRVDESEIVVGVLVRNCVGWAELAEDKKFAEVDQIIERTEKMKSKEYWDHQMARGCVEVTPYFC